MSLSGMLAWGQIRVKANTLVSWARWLPVAAWMGAIFYLSQQSAPPGSGAGTAWTSFAHVALYTGLALFLFLAMSRNGASRLSPPDWVLAIVTFSLTVLYGASDELHQAFVAGRTASEADVALDAVGAVFGVVLALLTVRLFAMRRLRCREGRNTH